MAGETKRCVVRRAVVRALVQACRNLELYVAPEVAERLARFDEAWVPLSEVLGILDLVAAPYPEPHAVLDRLGEEMVEAWFQKGAPAEPLAASVLLRELRAGYRAVVRGDVSDAGEIELLRYDEAHGEGLVRSTTPLRRAFERGVLRALLRQCSGVLGVEVEGSHQLGGHELRIRSRAGAAVQDAQPFAPEVFVELSTEELAELDRIGSSRRLQGEELAVFVEQARECERELERAQELVRTINGALVQALTTLGGQHRVLNRLVREQRMRTRAVALAERGLEEAREEATEVRAAALHLVDELSERLLGSRLLGRYEVLGRLGHGASSVVFEVRDAKAEELRALRVLRAVDAGIAPRIAATAERIAEARISGAPRVHEVFTWADAVPCVVTDRMEGRSLRRILSEKGTLNESQVATVARDLLDVLSAAHDAGISHGDVRPENVIVTRAGASLLELELSGVSAELPEPRSARAYRPHDAREAPTPAGDVFALGVVLLELLGGEVPLEGLVLRAPASRVGALCASALDPSPEGRPTARALGEALGSLESRVSLVDLASESAGGRRPSGFYDRGDAGQRRRNRAGNV